MEFNTPLLRPRVPVSRPHVAWRKWAEVVRTSVHATAWLPASKGAVRYLFQIWMVKQVSSTVIVILTTTMGAVDVSTSASMTVTVTVTVRVTPSPSP